jgi:hypothetical protein
LLLRPYNRQKYLILPAQNKIVEPSFNIQTNNGLTAAHYLLAEAGPQGLSVVAADMDSRTVTHCMVWHFAANTQPDAAAEQLLQSWATEPLLQQFCQKAELLYSFPDVVPTPHEMYRSVDAATILADVYGDANTGPVKTDFVYKHNLHNVYRLPVAAERLLLRGNSVATSHQYSMLLNQFEGSDDALWAIFYPHSLTVLLRRSGQLQIVQQFAYTVPEDAAWQLLAVCHQFGVPAGSVPLTLYGMIDAQSALYAELYKYFLHISFAGLPQGLHYPDAVHQLPAHFFSHLFASLLCV